MNSLNQARSSNFNKQTMQVWILSEYGKPIFSSCGCENELSDKFALVHTLVKRYEAWGDDLLSLQTKSLFIRFCRRSPLILCIISKQPFNLSVQLDMVYDQVVSILSKTRLEQIYAKKNNFDLRDWLTDIDKRVDACMKGFNEDPVIFFSGFRILPLAYTDREFLHNTMANEINQTGADHVVFGILVAHRQLVVMVRQKNFNLNATDFSILISFIECHSFQIGQSENFIPICLPHYNPDNSGFKELDPSYTLKNIRMRFEEKINAWEKEKVIHLKNSLIHPDSTIKMETGDLWHFVYKNMYMDSSQICCSSPQKPWITPEEIATLNNGYYKLSSMMRKGNKMKMFFFQLESYSLFSWLTQNFELHCTFSPLVTQKTAMIIAEKMLRILRQDEKRVFFLIPPGVLNG